MTDVASSFNKVQQEALQYNNPTSEASLASLAGPINGILGVLLPVGSIVDTMLTEAQFQAQLGSPSPVTWILADGRSVVGSSYASLVGSTVPDLRGIFVRGKNNGRADGNQNPDGNLALGTFTTSRNLAHAHNVTDPTHSHNYSQGGFGGDNRTSGSAYGANGAGSYGNVGVSASATGISIQNDGGGDAAPSNVTVNKMIRIN